MATIFTLEAQVLGTPLTVSAEPDGAGGSTVHTSTGPVGARTVNDAIRIARRDIGEFLLPAQRGDRPWGLRVSVAGAQAVYGEWPLLQVAGGGARSDDSPITRIRNRWHDSGPISALENAIEIIRAYVPPGRIAA